jgi:predicted NBD/HSP70 family sugar kinase
VADAAAFQKVEDLVSLAENGDSGVQAIFTGAAEVLGRSIANLINIFNPNRIVISGEGTRAAKWIFPVICDTIHKMAMPDLINDVEIKIDTWGDDAWARGAASLVLQELFESPVRKEKIST